MGRYSTSTQEAELSNIRQESREQMPDRTPLLILGDAPSAQTGLGRILRDLAIRVHTHLSDTYDVGTLGYGGSGDRNLPFPQYQIENMQDWFIPNLREVWDNFAGDRKGIVMTIWDASRLLWFARPDTPAWCPDPKMREWLRHPPFKRWGYFPMDATGPHNRLSIMQRECVVGYDRILAYSSWAEGILRNSIMPETAERTGLTFLPHGIDTSVFRPQRVSRDLFHDELSFNGPPIQPEEKIIGIVATNQARKDYGLAIQAIAELAKENPIRLYIQTDILERYWSIPALLMDYGLIPHTIVNANPLSDAMMARIYSLCDLTLGIGAGEGFGYPIFESLACGTPVLTGTYGGHAEWFPLWLMTPKLYRMEGLFNSVRPVYDPKHWSYHAGKMLREGKSGESLLPSGLDWENLWPKWEGWFRNDQTRPLPASSPAPYGSNLETRMAQSDQNTLTAGGQEDPSGCGVGPTVVPPSRKS